MPGVPRAVLFPGAFFEETGGIYGALLTSCFQQATMLSNVPSRSSRLRCIQVLAAAINSVFISGVS